jgi:hypothetical protein
MGAADGRRVFSCDGCLGVSHVGLQRNSGRYQWAAATVIGHTPSQELRNSTSVNPGFDHLAEEWPTAQGSTGIAGAGVAGGGGQRGIQWDMRHGSGTCIHTHHTRRPKVHDTPTSCLTQGLRFHPWSSALAQKSARTPHLTSITWASSSFIQPDSPPSRLLKPCVACFIGQHSSDAFALPPSKSHPPKSDLVPTASPPKYYPNKDHHHPFPLPSCGLWRKSGVLLLSLFVFHPPYTT